MLQGRRCSLIPTCGVFITMDHGFAGRTELPENLKSLFRPVAVTAPDTTLICEAILLSEVRTVLIHHCSYHDRDLHLRFS